MKILNSSDEEIHTVGAEAVKFVVEFDTPMKQEQNFYLYFGTTQPWLDTKVSGTFVTDYVWEGNFTVTSQIDSGINKTSFQGVKAIAKNDGWFNTLIDSFSSIVYNVNKQISFTIDMSQALSMNLYANPTNNGVELSWNQDDYDTLMGYNVYRSTSKDGNYVKLNTQVIPADEASFIDDSGEPGEEYWYTFTVVLSDLSESKPAGKVSCRTADTVLPVIYHTPVNQAYENTNLMITCVASDNIAVQSATLYYRTTGDVEWKTLPMNKQNDRYSATIFGSEITADGLEYYIAVSDGHNIVNRGDAENPYSVIVKDSALLNNLGDVDGDGIVTTKDALMIIKSLNGDIILTDDQFHRADLNKNGVLSTSEALRILQYINGNVLTLDM